MASQFTVYSRKQTSVMQYEISCLINMIYFNLLDIYYKEDILLARLHEVHRAIEVTSVVPVYVYVHVTLSVKVSYKSISLDHVDGSS